MSTTTTPEFGKMRSLFWPVHGYELKKFLPMVLMMFFFLFNYTIMRDTKDTLVVTAAGASVIPFLKVWGTLPVSILFVIVYSKLSNILRPTTLFYSMVAPFLVYCLIFGFVVYPNIDAMKPKAFADSLEQFVAANLYESSHDTLFKLIEMVRVWPYALFYVTSELWGSMGISLLFWQFANQITKPSEAKRFYAGFAQLGNLALVGSGLTIVYFSAIRDKVPAGVDAWGLTLKWLMGVCAFGCLVIMVTYYWINENVLTDSKLCEPQDNSSPRAAKKKKKKPGLKDSFMLLLRSKYLFCIATVVISYGITINLIEVVWKGQLKLYHPNPNDYNEFMGMFSMMTGFTTLALVTIGSNVIRKLGWRIAALTVPAVILVTGCIFFVCAYYRDSFDGVLPYSPVAIAVYVGAIQNILSKATKYSLFDPTKEMAYIPLDSESKIKGKAAIDVVGARLGKSGGSFALQIICAYGSLMDNLGLIFILIALVVVMWMRAVISLSGLYNEKLKEANLVE